VKYFYDTEFLEDGKTIELISIGIVTEDGREYYAVNADMPIDRIKNDRWLVENVWKSLPVVGYQEHLVTVGAGKNEIRCKTPGHLDSKSSLIRPRRLIANEVRDFILDGSGDVELWADYAAYDHVVLAQLFGKMIHLPEGIPMFTHDLQHALSRLPRMSVPVQSAGVHNALADARHLKVTYESCIADD
tara:strand:- start:5682 stop:6245 length:564 start_codon:yes stop_codon:yes gene_type:complete